MDLPRFFASIRAFVFTGRLPQSAVDGCEAIFASCRRYAVNNPHHVGVLVGWAVGENFIPPNLASYLDPATIDLIVTAVFDAIGTYLAPANKPAAA